MKIIKIKAILDFNKENYLVKDKVLICDELIQGIMNLENALAKYPNAVIMDFSDYILSPVFNNIHSHLEFCMSKLSYGDFAKWLGSIIKNREDIDKEKLNETIKQKINEMMKSGIGYLGEISSFGAELEILSKSPIKSIVFHEILGANKDVANKNIEFFESRFFKFNNLKNAISLHSPYSICNEIYDYAINFAKKNDLYISTHFAESKYEKPYLDGKNNALAQYLKRFNPDKLSRDFLSGFNDLKAIFTHCNYAKNSEFKPHHIITSCPRSNRYLGSKKLDLKGINNLSLGTDGLSSNDSLNFFDELRAALMLYNDYNLDEISYKLYKAACFDTSYIFLDGLSPLSINASADFMLLDSFGYSDDELLTQIILRTKEIKKMFLNGKEII